MKSDIGIIRGVLKTAKYLAETSKEPTYLYRYSVPNNHGEEYSAKNLNGAKHGDELAHLFQMGTELDEASQRISQRLLKLWTNFAKYGNPTIEKDEIVPVEWKPVTKDHLYYLDIGEELSLQENPEADRMVFWDNLYQSHPRTKDY